MTGFIDIDRYAVSKGPHTIVFDTLFFKNSCGTDDRFRAQQALLTLLGI